MLVELSARELAYTTAVLGATKLDILDTPGLEAYELLYEACLTDVQATVFLHEYEGYLSWTNAKKLDRL